MVTLLFYGAVEIPDNLASKPEYSAITQHCFKNNRHKKGGPP